MCAVVKFQVHCRWGWFSSGGNWSFSSINLNAQSHIWLALITLWELFSFYAWCMWHVISCARNGLIWNNASCTWMFYSSSNLGSWPSYNLFLPLIARVAFYSCWIRITHFHPRQSAYTRSARIHLVASLSGSWYSSIYSDYWQQEGNLEIFNISHASPSLSIIGVLYQSMYECIS